MLRMIWLTLLLCSTQLAAVEIKIEDVNERVSTRNYVVLENAQLTYQSREAISFARANLLPQLNLWDYVGVIFSWTSVLDAVTDIAPFLVPANWFRLKEQKILFEAQRHGYHALWANQILSAKGLFYRLQHDESLLQLLQEQKEELSQFHTIIKTREIFGGARPGDALVLEKKMLELENDQKSLEYLIAEEKSHLRYMLAVDAAEDVTLVPVSVNVDERVPLDFHKVAATALERSPETKQFREFIRVIPHIKKEVRFSFLGTSSIARGVGGGIFDDIPIQRGLGFGAGHTLAILRSKEEIMKLQLKGIEETIRNQLRVLVNIYNSDLDYYRQLQHRLIMTKNILASYHDRLSLGESVDVWDIVEASKSVMNAEIQLQALMSRVLDNSERLERQLMSGGYTRAPKFEDLVQ